MGRGKKHWSKEAHERAYNRLLETMEKPFDSNANVKKNRDNIKEDFPRY